MDNIGDKDVVNSKDGENNSDVSSFKEEFIPSISRNTKKGKQKVPLWLITFTDVMALMLTFFVLLYAMSVPEQEKWEEVSISLGSNLKKAEVKPYNSGSQDVISIDKISTSRALDLTYLKVIITNLLKADGIENILIFQNGNRLVVSIPSKLLFKSGSANIGLEGKKILFSLGGALSRVKNRIEVVGHTDPRPITGGSKNIYKTNWELSLARSSSVAAVLQEVGYERHVTVRGVSSARFDELSGDIPEDIRYNLSRRVDIVLMNDAGFRVKLYSLK